MVYGAKTEAMSREQACAIAYEIVSRGNLLSHLAQQLHLTAYTQIAVSEPSEVAEREAAYHMVRAVNMLVGNIENLAAEHRRVLEKRT